MAVLVISYSRVDQPQVRAVVSLLKTALRDIDKAVFWDGDFEPGDAWFQQITRHIDAAPQLFVFWCEHSRSSEQVRREFSYAFARNKRVVPVLLDDTPLTLELAPVHGIDLRGTIHHPRHAFPRARRIRRLAIATAASVLLLVGLFSLLTTRAPSHSPAIPVVRLQFQNPPQPRDLVEPPADIRAKLDDFAQKAQARFGRSTTIKAVSKPEFAKSAQLAVRYLQRNGVDVDLTIDDGVEGFTIEAEPAPQAGAPPYPVFHLTAYALIGCLLLIGLWLFGKWRKRRLIVSRFSLFLAPYE